MLATLAAALSLAASIAIDVPYLPQTDALCGGAAARFADRVELPSVGTTAVDGRIGQ